MPLSEQEEARLLSAMSAILDQEPGAKEFVKAYNDYVHAIDDIIDEKEYRDNPEFILHTFALAESLFSSTFYQKYSSFLYPVIQRVRNTYADSVLWEKSSEDWKRRHADALRHCGMDVFFAVIELIAGYDAVRSISPMFREYSHYKHLHDFKQT